MIISIGPVKSVHIVFINDGNFSFTEASYSGCAIHSTCERFWTCYL